MGAITPSKKIYDEIAKKYFESKGYTVQIHGSGPYPDLTAQKNHLSAIIEVKGPMEKEADKETTYENKIGNMSRPEISDLLDDVIDRKTIWGSIGLTMLYIFGIISELYHYYKVEQFKHLGLSKTVEAFFCIPNESKNIVAMNLALIILKGTGFIHLDSALHGEHTEQKNKIKVFKIIFNENINKKEVKKNTERDKEKIQDEIEKEISKTKKIKMPNWPLKFYELTLSILQIIKSAILTNLSLIKSAISSVLLAIGGFFSNPITLKLSIIAFIIIMIGWIVYNYYPFGMGMKQQQATTVQNEIAPSVVIPTLQKEPKTVTVWFGFASSELITSAKEDLDKYLSEIHDNVNQKIIIEGHTCTIGSNEYNRRLSLKRAEAAKSYILQKSNYAMEIIPDGYSFEKPIGNNNTKDGRAKNRRAEIYIQPKE